MTTTTATTKMVTTTLSLMSMYTLNSTALKTCPNAVPERHPGLNQSLPDSDDNVAGPTFLQSTSFSQSSPIEFLQWHFSPFIFRFNSLTILS